MQKASNLASGGISGLLWLTSSSAAQSAIQLGVVAVLARLLTPQDFGVVAAATAIVGFTKMFSELGLGPALVQLPEISDKDIDTAYIITIVFSVGIGALLWISTPWVAAFYDMELLKSVFPALVLLVPVTAFGSTSENLVQRELGYRKLALIDFAGYTVGMGGVGIGLALAGFGVWALVFANLARSILQAVALFLSHPFRFRGHFSVRSVKRLARLGGGFTMASLFNYAARKGDYVVIGGVLSADALGLYSKAYSLMDAGNKVLGRALKRVLFPSVAKLQKDERRLSLIFEHGIAGLALLIMPVVVAVAYFSDEIVRILLGHQWMDAGPLLQILALGMFLRLGYKVGGNLAKGTGAVYRQSIVQGVYATIIVGGAFVGASYWGITGAALSTLIGLGVNYIMLSALGMKVSGASIRQFARAHVLGVIGAILTSLLLLLLGTLDSSVGIERWVSLVAGAVIVCTIIVCLLFVDIGKSTTNQWIRSHIRNIVTIER